jgi:CHAD domain-containing protein
VSNRFAIAGVNARTLLGEAAPALLLAKADPLFALETAARGGADLDAVHDMRVASRRLREAMRLLAPIYPPREFRTWYKRVRHITRTLGPVRDADVFIDDLSRMGRDLANGGKRAVAFLVGYRTGLRETDLAVLNRELSKLDLAVSRASFSALAHSAGHSPEAAKPLADFAHAAVAERAATVFGAQPAALEEANVLEQHALRIDYKRLRYAVEVFAPCYGDEFDEIHATLTAFQDTLGDLHDLHLFAEIVRQPERGEAAKRAGVSAGDLAQVATRLDERAAAQFENFRQLSEVSPPQALLPRLLLPLAKAPAIQARAAVVSPETTTAEKPPAPLIADATVVDDYELELAPDSGVPTLEIAQMPVTPANAERDEPWALAPDDEGPPPMGERDTA